METIASFIYPVTINQVLATVWSLVALYGMLINVYGFVQARDDLRLLREAGLNGFRSVIAKGNVRDEGIRAFIQFLFISIGVLVLLDVPNRIFFTTTCFILAAALMVFKSHMNQHDRRQLLTLRRYNGIERRISQPQGAPMTAPESGLAVVSIPTKKWWQSKTVIANAIFLIGYAITLVIELAAPLALSPQVILWLGILQTIVNVALRLITSQAIAGTTPSGGQPARVAQVERRSAAVEKTEATVAAAHDAADAVAEDEAHRLGSR